MSNKIWDLANNDLTFIAIFLGKIKAMAVSTSCYLTHYDNSTETINDVQYMLKAIESLSKTADEQLTEISDKLCKISHEVGKEI